ncbi:MAG: YkvA family protein [Bacteroidia bacterium]
MDIQNKLAVTTAKAKAQIEKAEQDFLGFADKMKGRAEELFEGTEADAQKQYDRAKGKAEKARKKWRKKKQAGGEKHTGIARILKSVFATAIALAAKKNKVLDLVEGAYDKIGSEQDRGSLQKEGKDKITLLLRMLKAYYQGNYPHVPWEVLIKIIAGILYFVLLIDLVPDFIPLIGYVDDLVVIMWVYNSISDELDRFKEWEDRKLYP